MKNSKQQTIQSALLAFLLTSACVAPETHSEQTVGEHFRRVLGQIDQDCKRLKSGPYLDRRDADYRKRVGDTSCDILNLAPKDWRQAKLVTLDSQPYPVPEHWLSTPEGRFAHSIKLPAPHGTDKTLFRHNTSGEEYFEVLCSQYAGQYIFRKATDVRVVRQDRPWLPAPSGYRDLVFWVREKGGLHDAPTYLLEPPLGNYESIEVRLSEFDASKIGAKFRVYHRVLVDPTTNAHRSPSMADSARSAYVIASAPRQNGESEFGYTWRGIWPTGGVEHGIEGFELIVYQVEPLDVLAYQRDFWRHLPDPSQHDPRVTRTATCSERLHMLAPHQFLQAVLVPAPRRP